jgi:hypothetical protein
MKYEDTYRDGKNNLSTKHGYTCVKQCQGHRILKYKQIPMQIKMQERKPIALKGLQELQEVFIVHRPNAVNRAMRR